MPLSDVLGQILTLTVRRLGPPGAFLAVNAHDEAADAPSILLPRAEVPDDARIGASFDVFVYLDSEDRPVATRLVPHLQLDEVAFLPVTAVTRIGAFVDWGLPKELLVPFAEQTRDLAVGDRHPIGLYLDSSGRLAGTMRIAEMIDDPTGEFGLDEWVDGEAWRNDPQIGLFVILDRAFVGLVPAAEPHTLERGQAGSFRVTNILPDGKIELSLRGPAHQELENDARRILAFVARPGAPRVGDKSTPETVRTLLGLSKKAFKRAVGGLLRRGSIRIDNEGFILPLTSPAPPVPPVARRRPG